MVIGGFDKKENLLKLITLIAFHKNQSTWKFIPNGKTASLDSI